MDLWSCSYVVHTLQHITKTQAHVRWQTTQGWFIVTYTAVVDVLWNLPSASMFIFCINWTDFFGLFSCPGSEVRLRCYVLFSFKDWSCRHAVWMGAGEGKLLQSILYLGHSACKEKISNSFSEAQFWSTLPVRLICLLVINPGAFFFGNWLNCVFSLHVLKANARSRMINALTPYFAHILGRVVKEKLERLTMLMDTN